MQLYNRHTMPKGTEATYIGRGTSWGNPFKVNKEDPPGTAANRYRAYLARFLAARNKDAVTAVTTVLEHGAVCCSCTPRPCHGDCFVEIANIRDSQKVTAIQAINIWVKQNGYGYGPETDGVDHINIYSKGKTQLGRDLTNLSNLPVTISGAGAFKSMEGYWYWLSTGGKHECLMEMSGFEAKKFASNIPDVDNADFKDLIRRALWLRMEQNEPLKKALRESTLPLKHYYSYGSDNPLNIYPMFDWVTEEHKLLRDLLQGKKSACVIAGSRTIMDYDRLCREIDEADLPIDVVVCGGANGVDRLGERWAKEHGKLIRYFIPDWDILGKGAGFIRNQEMAKFAQSGIVLIDNDSSGSVHMRNALQSLGKPVFPPS